MKVLIVGANGFIGKNLVARLHELKIQVATYTRDNQVQDLEELVRVSDYIVHLAGENRPKDEENFDTVNVGLTASICDAVRASRKKIPVIFTSSVQAESNNTYGRSKLKAEDLLDKLEADTSCPVYIYRLPGVFGKWCKPNYNSVVATFCYNISRNLPIQVSDPNVELRLVHVDDVVNEFVRAIQRESMAKEELTIRPEYKINLGDLANQISAFQESRDSLIMEKVGTGLIGRLYSTFLSYLSPGQFPYQIPSYSDERGIFAEILKTKDSGQFSFFTIHPGLTRGGHYHHTRTEKFLVIQGEVRFKFKSVDTGELHEINASGKDLAIVDIAPGWSHSVTNLGADEALVILWSNEIFDPGNPDTILYSTG